MTALLNEVDQWFSEYFSAFIDIGAGKIGPDKILLYWSAPFHTSSPTHSKWLKSSEEVVGALNQLQEVLKQIGYTHTKAIDKVITVHNDNASRVDTIMSRRRGDGAEIDRAMVSFELRRVDGDWIIISSTAHPTDVAKLNEI